ncbi:anti-virulence regulator CigR family protein [Halomonas sp. Mc5H-6]|uniref:anti-virulence regulator CigR family protein n=1 Tax=Halomonas sp. Mc5H-6 TaxID=2954500 RepID=UPI0034295062
MNLFKIAVPSALIALMLSSATLAQPDHAPAHGARDNSHHQGQAPKREHRSYDDRAERNYRDDPPRIEERLIQRLLREYGAPRAEALPPGIERNLARGKPLPPGIAKRFDGPIANELPRYPGYEWQRVGADVVLIDAATRVVVDILVDALR